MSLQIQLFNVEGKRIKTVKLANATNKQFDKIVEYAHSVCCTDPECKYPLKRIKAQPGEEIPDPLGLEATVRLCANEKDGIAFDHPTKGMCGMTYRDMKKEEWERIKDY